MWMRGLKRACSGHHKPLLTSRPMWARGLKPVVEVAVVEVLLLYISLVGGLFLLFLLFLLRLWALVYGILKDGG